MTAISRLIQAVNDAENLAAVLSLIVRHVCDATPAEACSIFLIDPERGEYLLSATEGLNPNAVGKLRVKFGEGVVGWIGEREQVIGLPDIQASAHYRRRPSLEERDFHGYLGVPIIHQGELLGVLVAQQKAATVFEEEDEAYLITLSAQISDQLAQAIARGALTTLAQKRGRKKRDTILLGISGAQGVAVGKAVVVYPPADLDAVPDREASDIKTEIRLFEEALTAARAEIHELRGRAERQLSVAENALFDAYLRILDSRSLMNEVETEIEKGQWAQSALKRVIKRHIMRFENLEDAYLRERAADFRDLGRRILAQLQANKREAVDYPKQVLLVSEEVTATMLMEVPEGRLSGIISGTGSSNSHVAILARALGVPTVMGVTGSTVAELAGKELIVDGYNGQVYVSPSAALKKEFHQIALEEAQLDAELSALRDEPAETTDGHPVKLFVNTGLAIDGGLSLSVGAEGVGLYRTEVPFMLRERFPTEAEQRVMYRQLLNTFAPKPVIMRTLDVGGDKPLPYFPMSEDNPFLGWRGIRITLDHPELFLQQLRAMLQASEGLDNLSIMLPMVTSVSEVERSQQLLHQAFEELSREGLAIARPALGVMIEVPSAVYQAKEIAKKVDFLSVGSNDLIQYLLAVDRNNPRVANLYNAFHPAVIRALHAVVKAGHKAGKKVTICGEMAGDPVAVLILLGMGFDALSMSARALLRVKWVLRNFSVQEAQALLKAVLKIDDPIEVRCHLEMALEEAGLGGLIRAGK